MLSPKLLQILRRWWPVNKPKQWLFPGDRVGGHITRAAVEDACQKAHRISRISKPITPHSLRHYLPFRIMSSNRELLRIQPGNPQSPRAKPQRIARHSLCLLQTLPEVRGRSLNRVQGSSLLARDLENGAICDGEGAPRRSAEVPGWR